MIDQNRMEEAIQYLANTDELYANAKAHADGLKETLKIVQSTLFLKMTGKTQAERKEQAIAHTDYYRAVQKWQQAVQEVELLRAKRTTNTLIVDCWRSLNANRNKGGF